MKLKTIWTLRGMGVAERVSRTKELFWMRSALLLPKKLAYWSYIHTGVRNIKPDEVATNVHYMTILKRVGNQIN